MNKVKAAAIVLAVVLSCLAAVLLIAYYAMPDNSTSDINNTEVFRFENQLLANTASSDYTENIITLNMTDYVKAEETEENTPDTMSEVFAETTTAVTVAETTATTTTTTTTETSSTTETVQQTTTTTTIVTVAETVTMPVVTETTAVTETFVVPEEWFYMEENEEVHYEETVEDYYYEEYTEPEVTDTYYYNTSYVSDIDFILLCNAVAHEAGSDWIDLYSKANVVEVIMNRVNSPLYPNTVYDVLSQPYQFEGSGFYVNMTSYSCEVTDSVIAAVNLYFNEPYSFMNGYFSFYGDGYQNYFS